jgi:hypothetical protein
VPPAVVCYNAVPSPFGRALDATFEGILATTWRHLDPEEMYTVRLQAQELRDRKRY